MNDFWNYAQLISGLLIFAFWLMYSVYLKYNAKWIYDVAGIIGAVSGAVLFCFGAANILSSF